MNKVYCIIVGLWLLPLWANAAQVCQTANIPASTPTARFTNHGDGTVTDTQTGLRWKQCAEGLSGTDCTTGAAQTFTWQAALQQAQTLNTTGGFAGFTDWRLPNIKELRSIVERQCYSPAINFNVFPNTPSASFWSSSPVAYFSSNAWYVYFDNGDNDWGNKNYARQVRLVRSGQ